VSSAGVSNSTSGAATTLANELIIPLSAEAQRAADARTALIEASFNKKSKKVVTEEKAVKASGSRRSTAPGRRGDDDRLSGDSDTDDSSYNGSNAVDSSIGVKRRCSRRDTTADTTVHTVKRMRPAADSENADGGKRDGCGIVRVAVVAGETSLAWTYWPNVLPAVQKTDSAKVISSLEVLAAKVETVAKLHEEEGRPENAAKWRALLARASEAARNELVAPSGEVSGIVFSV
jgi:hypothetical protein